MKLQIAHSQAITWSQYVLLLLKQPFIHAPTLVDIVIHVSKDKFALNSEFDFKMMLGYFVTFQFYVTIIATPKQQSFITMEHCFSDG